MITRIKYNPKEIEGKWQKLWEAEEMYQAPDNSPKPKFYNLVMLPYPSGNLHMGHWYNFAPADAYGRFIHMQGYNVMQPMGFDAFGLPAENAAISHACNSTSRDWPIAPKPRLTGVQAATRRWPTSKCCPTVLVNAVAAW